MPAPCVWMRLLGNGAEHRPASGVSPGAGARPRRGRRNLQDDAQSGAAWGIGGEDTAAMQLGDAAADGKPEPTSLLVPCIGREVNETLEHAQALLGAQSRALVVDA